MSATPLPGLQMIHSSDFETAGDLSSEAFPPHGLYIPQDSAIYKLGGPVTRIICSGNPFDVMLCNKDVCARCSGGYDLGSGLTVDVSPGKSLFRGRPFLHKAEHKVKYGGLEFNPAGTTEASYEVPEDVEEMTIVVEDTYNEVKPRVGSRGGRPGLVCNVKLCSVCTPTEKNKNAEIRRKTNVPAAGAPSQDPPGQAGSTAAPAPAQTQNQQGQTGSASQPIDLTSDDCQGQTTSTATQPLGDTLQPQAREEGMFELAEPDIGAFNRASSEMPAFAAPQPNNTDHQVLYSRTAPPATRPNQMTDHGFWWQATMTAIPPSDDRDLREDPMQGFMQPANASRPTQQSTQSWRSPNDHAMYRYPLGAAA